MKALYEKHADIILEICPNIEEFNNPSDEQLKKLAKLSWQCVSWWCPQEWEYAVKKAKKLYEST